MVELYIDGIPAALPEKFSFDIVKENPFFQKNGEYTFDITLSLSNPVNAKLYNHIDRTNNKTEIEKRRAILICENKVMLNGTEVILSNTNHDVKIQLVSGNSELNYFSGSDKKVSELDLGECDIDLDKARKSLFYCYPEYNYCCPYITFDNGYGFGNLWKPNPTLSSGGLHHGDVIPQPYLLYYIEEIPKVLGYKMEYNVLREDEMFLRTYIANRVNTKKYVDYLPDWTVAEFFEEIEKFLNVLFIVDQQSKKVSILRPYNYLSSANKIYLKNDQIIDEFEREHEKDSSNNQFPFFVENKNIKYAFPSGDIFSYLSIPNEILKYADIIKFDTFDGLFEEAKNQDFIDKYFKTRTIFYAEDVETYYMIIGSYHEERNPCLRSINIFQPIGEEKNALELKITPVMFIDELEVLRPVVGGPRLIPYSSNSEIKENSLSDNFNDMILDGVPKKDYVENLEIAIYVGVYSDIEMGEVEYIKHTDRFPQSTTDYMGACKYYYPPNNIELRKRNHVNNWTLRLQGKHGIVTKTRENHIFIDINKPVTYYFLSHEIHDVRNIFQIRNSEFLCKQLIYKITEKGLSPITEGIFYPLEGFS